MYGDILLPWLVIGCVNVSAPRDVWRPFVEVVVNWCLVFPLGSMTTFLSRWLPMRFFFLAFLNETLLFGG